MRVVVIGGGFAGVEISCNLAAELGKKAPGGVEITLASKSEVKTKRAGRVEMMQRLSSEQTRAPSNFQQCFFFAILLGESLSFCRGFKGLLA